MAYPSNHSLLSLFGEAMSYSLTANNSRGAIPNIMITNSGSQRFDVYSGAFTKNDQLTASPFADAFLYIPNVTLSVAKQVLPSLNHAGVNERRALTAGGFDAEAYARGDVDMVYRAWLEDMDKRSNGAVRRAAQNATLGYVTHDVRLFLNTLVFPRSRMHLLVCSLALESAMTPSTRLW